MLKGLTDRAGLTDKGREYAEDLWEKACRRNLPKPDEKPESQPHPVQAELFEEFKTVTVPCPHQCCD